MTDHIEQATAEARERGMAFLVDGFHVAAERVTILSLPDTIGPISAMRQAKVEAKKALQELTMTLKVEADTETLKALNGCIALLRGCYDALAANHGLVRSETRLAIGKFLEQIAAPYATGGVASADATYAVNQGEAILPKKTTPASDTPVGIKKHLCTSPRGGFACTGCDCGAPRKGMATPAPAPAAAIINGILVTDPDLMKPITDDVAPGVTTLCFECGQPTSGGNFCDAHAHLA